MTAGLSKDEIGKAFDYPVFFTTGWKFAFDADGVGTPLGTSAFAGLYVCFSGDQIMFIEPLSDGKVHELLENVPFNQDLNLRQLTPDLPTTANQTEPTAAALQPPPADVAPVPTPPAQSAPASPEVAPEATPSQPATAAPPALQPTPPGQVEAVPSTPPP
jgi:hypothetical protein